MSENLSIAHELTGNPEAPVLIVWAHGWGHDRSDFLPFLPPLLQKAQHLVIDFPGFGKSPLPPLTWGTADYADAMAAFLAPFRAGKKLVWVGHSFGGRVGVQLAARHPESVDGLFIVAGAGLQRKRGLWKTLCVKARVASFKIMKRIVEARGGDVEAFRSRYGSADYKNAGALRPLFVRVVREDLSDVARQIHCPTRLVYGSDDTETPPEFGHRYEKLISGATLTVLEGQDHLSLLGAGRPLVQKRLAAFLETL